MRRAHDAIAEIHQYGTQGYRWVLDADIEACFDSIDHTALMDRVRGRVKDKRVLTLVKAFLKAGIFTELGENKDTPTGTPQGGIFLTATRGACVISGDFGMVELAEGDFVVLNSRAGFRVGSAPDAVAVPASRLRAEFSSGPLQVGWGEEDARVLLGHYELATANSELVTALLPTISVLRKDDLDATTVSAQVTMLVESVVRPRPGSELVIERLADVVLVGLIGRTTSGPEPPAGFLRGLAHSVVGAALQAMHQDASRPWSVDSLARESGVSRSTLAAQFLTVTGTTPMAYLLTWRMALAKEAVARGEKSHAQIARSVGYGSVSSFSTAFRRYVGRSPAQFAASLKADLA